MPPKNVPYRDGYRMETRFPKKGNLLTPLHGAGPRCRVDYSPDDAGPWVMVQIMRIDDDQTEHFRCAMPRHYAIPLILINKWLYFFEVHCAPDGTPLPLGNGTPSLQLRDIRQYTYLWRLRCRFLQALFDMNHEQRLDEAWQCDRIHGFMHRTYKGYGHNAPQRRAYWKREAEAGRMPYATPSIADMDWKAFLDMEMRASTTRLNAFLWNRISQGYSRVVQVDPPFASWQAWRRGGTSRDLSASLYRTPPPPSRTPAPFPMPARRRRSSRNGSAISLSEEPDSSAAAEKQPAVVGTAAAAAGRSAAAAARGKERAAADPDDNDPGRRCSAATFVAVGDNNNVDCGGVLAATIDGSQEWALTLPMSDLSRGASQAAASTCGMGDPSHGRTRTLFVLDVPKGMAVTDVLWTVSREEDVSNGHKTNLRVNYGSDPC